MLYSGVSWNEEGYRLAVLDDSGRPAAAPAGFAPARTDDLVDHLRRLGAPVVIDSTLGILDGRLMAAGVEVYRADPPVLPPRPAFGSVPAEALAATLRDRAPLARLVRTQGTQTGREEILAGDARDSETALRALIGGRRCLAHGDRGRAEVALTFDDGPQQPWTGQILDVLARYRVPATFFCVGLNAAAHPELLARMVDEGHAVGNHTYSHPFLPELTRAQFTEQIERTDEAVTKAAGAAPTLFRPPYGARTPEVVGWLGDLDATTVLWDVEPFDWAMPGSDVIARRVLDDTRPGSVILLHDGGGDRSQVVEALPAVIEDLLARSYRFVRADDLVAAGR